MEESLVFIFLMGYIEEGSIRLPRKLINFYHNARCHTKEVGVCSNRPSQCSEKFKSLHINVLLFFFQINQSFYAVNFKVC